MSYNLKIQRESVSENIAKHDREDYTRTTTIDFPELDNLFERWNELPDFQDHNHFSTDEDEEIFQRLGQYNVDLDAEDDLDDPTVPDGSDHEDATEPPDDDDPAATLSLSHKAFNLISQTFKKQLIFTLIIHPAWTITRQSAMHTCIYISSFL